MEGINGWDYGADRQLCLLASRARLWIYEPGVPASYCGARCAMGPALHRFTEIWFWVEMQTNRFYGNQRVEWLVTRLPQLIGAGDGVPVWRRRCGDSSGWLCRCRRCSQKGENGLRQLHSGPYSFAFGAPLAHLPSLRPSLQLRYYGDTTELIMSARSRGPLCHKNKVGPKMKAFF